MTNGDEVIGLLLKLTYNLKKQLNLVPIGYAIGPAQWLMVEQAIRENKTMFPGYDDTKPMQDLKVAGLPVQLKGANGIELLIDPSGVSQMFKYNQEYAKEIVAKPAPVIVMPESEIVH